MNFYVYLICSKNIIVFPSFSLIFTPKNVPEFHKHPSKKPPNTPHNTPKPPQNTLRIRAYSSENLKLITVKI